MNIEQLEEKAKILQQELEELKKEIEERKNNRWKPKDGETYHYIIGVRDTETHFEEGFLADEDRLSIGNYFQTQEEVFFAIERLKVLEEIKEFAEPINEKWDGNTKHFMIFYNYIHNFIDIDSSRKYKYGCIYFESKEKAMECIDTIGGERIKKYYLGIE